MLCRRSVRYRRARQHRVQQQPTSRTQICVFVGLLLINSSSDHVGYNFEVQLYAHILVLDEQHRRVLTLTVYILRKNVAFFIFVITYSDVIQFCQFLAETYSRKFGTNTINCTGNHISFHMFVLCRVKSSNDFYSIQ